jgi:hypothetical protein
MFIFGLHLFFFNAHESQVWFSMMSLSSYTFLSQLLTLLCKNSSIFSLICMSLSTETLSCICSSLLDWLSNFFIGFRGFLFPGFPFDSFYWDFLHLVLYSLFHIFPFCNFLSFILLFFYCYVRCGYIVAFAKVLTMYHI